MKPAHTSAPIGAPKGEQASTFPGEASPVRIFHATPQRLEAGIPLGDGAWLSVDARRHNGETAAVIDTQHSLHTQAVLAELPALREHLSRLGLSMDLRSPADSAAAQHSQAGPDTRGGTQQQAAQSPHDQAGARPSARGEREARNAEGKRHSGSSPSPGPRQQWAGAGNRIDIHA